MNTSNTSNAITKAEWARQKNVNRSTVTRWVAAGRVITDAEGNVLVSETEAQLALTADPEKVGVVERHAQTRGAEVGELLTSHGEDKPKGKSEHYDSRVKQSARREAAKAERAEIELARLKGELTDVAGVEKAQVDFATMMREKYGRLAQDLQFDLAVESDPAKVLVILKNALEKTAIEIAQTLTAQIEATASTQQ